MKPGGLVAVDDNYIKDGVLVGKGVYVYEMMESIGATLLHKGVQCVWKIEG